jgi:hypothetical protein
MPSKRQNERCALLDPREVDSPSFTPQATFVLARISVRRYASVSSYPKKQESD